MFCTCYLNLDATSTMEQIEKEKILKIVQDFYSKTMEIEPNDGMCFISAYALSEHLKNKDIEYSFVCGFVNNCSHYWLEYKNNINIDLTPNQNQFKRTMPFEVPYIGELDASYVPMRNNIVNIIDNFSESFLKSIYNQPYNGNVPPKKLIPDYLNILTKGAIVLIKDNKNHISNRLYFNILFKAYYGYLSEDNISYFEKIPDWNIFETMYMAWFDKNTDKMTLDFLLSVSL